MVIEHTDTNQLPGAESVAGLVLRRYGGEDDHADMSRAANERRIAAGMIPGSTPEDIGNTYRNLVNCDPARDIAIAELDGSVVGYARVFWDDESNGDRAFYFITNLGPRADGRGVARAVLAWQESRVAAFRARMTDVRRPMVEVAFVDGDDADQRRALENARFALARRHAEMRRANLHAIPALPLPDGLEIRPIDLTDRAMHRRVYDGDIEAFQDHWGAVAGSEAGFREFVGASSFNPMLWRVAFDGDEIAGQILNYLGPIEPDGSRIGWTESISVRRPWRRRGLARALLAASLRAVQEAGATSAALGVDQQNPNQALTLYESLGFRLTAEEFEYRKQIAEGAHEGDHDGR